MLVMLGEWDYRLFVGINSGWAHPWLDPLFVFFSLGIKELWLRLFFGGLFVGLLFFRTTRFTALGAVGAWLLANEVTDAFKYFLPVPRPCVELGTSEVRLLVPLLTSSGTVSAHSAAMASVAFVFAWRHRWWVVPWVVVALLTGLSRIYVGVHYPSQVLLGWMLGVLCAYGVLKVGSLGSWLLQRRREREDFEKSEREERTEPI
ncbi:MAG: phosphatase PAP2 family protein [Fimbriimonadales bacterium]|nr:phosphatase PAP2 family protein [Fimbriimonadales bacterium]